MNIYQEFSRKRIINNLAKYEMYYQVSSGNLIKTTSSLEVTYEIELSLALGSIYEMIKDIETLDTYVTIFEKELKKQSAMDALQNFVNKNLEAVKNSKIQVESIINNINDDIFFNPTMLEICKKNEKNQIKKWEEIISIEVSDAIIKSLADLENS